MLNSLDCLLGQWQAVSRPGEPAGGFTFAPKLQSKVIVRTNYADYPATDDRPDSRHEDLMVIYSDESQNLQADYYDSEGHIIHYAGQVPQPGQVIFTSTPTTGGPGFRLTYRLENDGTLTGAFELASPTQPDVFAPYLTWSAIRISDEQV